MDGLKRLSGAKEVKQDDFASGVGTYIVTFDTPPVLKMADIKTNVGKYKLEKLKMKVTGKAVEKNKVWTVGALSLAKAKEGEDLLPKVAELKGKVLILVGFFVEDDKGKQCLELTSVEELPKKTK